MSYVPRTSSFHHAFAGAIRDPLNDNFRGIAIDTAGTRRSGASAWTAQNIGTSTVTVGGGELAITSPASASLQIRGYSQPVPSGNWCVRALLTGRGFPGGGEASYGMFLRDSASGRVEVQAIGPSGGTPILWGGKYTNNTTFSAFRASVSAGWAISGVAVLMEIEYDGTNYYYRLGSLGSPMSTWSQFAKTNFLTNVADQIGLFSENDQSVPCTLICRGFYRMPVSTVL